METIAGPKSFNVGAEPSSCQLTVAGLPPLKVVEATGEVVKTVANADADRERRIKVEENIVVVLKNMI
jgi:hypothetical protein